MGTRISTGLLAGAWALATSAAVLATPPSIEAFGNKPAMASVAINPAGTRLAWLEDDGKAPRIVIHDIAARKSLRRIVAAPGTKLWRVLWANDETVLIDESITHTIKGNRDYTDEWQRWVAVDASGGEERMLLMTDATRQWVSGLTLEAAHTSRPGKIFMSSWDWSLAKRREEIGTRIPSGRRDSGWTKNLYEVDLARGTGKQLAAGTAFTSDWLIDPTGDLITRSDHVPLEQRFEVFVKQGLGWRRIYETKGCDRLGLVGYSTDRTSIIAIGTPCNEDRHKLLLLPLDGSAPKVLHEDATWDVERVYRDPYDGRILGVAKGGPKQPTHWVDKRIGDRIATLTRSFGGSRVTPMSWTANSQRMVMLVEDGSRVPVYYLVDYDTKKAEIINEAYPQLAGVQLGDVSDFNYESRDKYALMGYLTIPPGSQGKNLPLVVMPHGGPEARDDPGFDWLSQFLASRGYAVLQPQFRGSSGFGRAHADAGRRQWGLRMQDDVTDGVKALIERGIADPRRVCIVGWSYGGYSALAGAAYTPDLYACAASIAGVSDLPTMLGWDGKNSGRESGSFAYWREHIGRADDAAVVEKSPARAAAAVKIPILLIHGVDDTIVPVSQSRRMATALQQLKKPVELIELEGEDHWMKTSSRSRIQTLTELQRFLGRHLGMEPQQTAAN